VRNKIVWIYDISIVIVLFLGHLLRQLSSLTNIFDRWNAGIWLALNAQALKDA